MPLTAKDVIDGVKAGLAAAKAIELAVDLLDGDVDKAKALLTEEQVKRANRVADALELAKFPAEFPD